MPQLLLSVIVPVYQAQNTIERCLDSLIAQSFGDLEIICVDDGSTDGSAELLDSYSRKDARIRVLSQRNGGVSAARNAGLDAATGAYVGFVDSDDFVALEMYATLLGLIESEKADCALCSYLRTNAKGEPLGGRYACSLDPARLRRRPQAEEMFIRVVCNKVIRKSLLLDNGIRFPAGVSYGEDTAFNYCLLPFCRRVAGIDLPLYRYVCRGGSLAQTAQSRAIELLEACAFVRRFYVERPIDASFRTAWLELLVHSLKRIRSAAPHRDQKRATEIMRALLAEFNPAKPELATLRAKDAKKLRLLLAGRSDLSAAYYWRKITRRLKRSLSR